MYHSQFAPTLAEVLPDFPQLTVLLQVVDESGNDLLPGALVRRRVSFPRRRSSRCAAERSPDDLYILYTGGTTGMPKGVLWRQHDITISVMGGGVAGTPHESLGVAPSKMSRAARCA